MALFGTPPASNRLDELRRILLKDPTSRQFLALAEEYRRLGKLRDAIITLERGLQIHGTSVAAHVALGKTYQQLDRLEDATRAFQNALRLDRENLVAIRQLVEVHLAKGDKVEAIKKLKLYRGLKPGDKDVDELIAQIEAETPALRDGAISGVKPRPVTSPASPAPVVSASSARRAALRPRGQPSGADLLLDKALSRRRSSTEISQEELYGSTPLLHRLWDEEEGAGGAPEGSAPAAPEPPGLPPERPPRAYAPAKPPSREIRALSFEYEVPVLSTPVEPPPAPPAAPPAVPPAPAPGAAAPGIEETAPFDDVPAAAPEPDFFDAPGELPEALSLSEPAAPVESPDKRVVPDDFEDPPTQPLFLETPPTETPRPRVVLRRLEPPPAPLEVSEPEPAAPPAPPPVRRGRSGSRLRAFAGRFPTRTSASVDDLRGCLQSLVAKAAGIRAAVLTDMEGLPVLTVGRAGERADARVIEVLVAEMASFLKNVRRTQDEVGEGSLTSLTLVGQQGTAIVSRVSHDYSLILQVDPQAALGEVRYEAARTAGTLRSAVG